VGLGFSAAHGDELPVLQIEGGRRLLAEFHQSGDFRFRQYFY
jgi:hypothetical protein